MTDVMITQSNTRLFTSGLQNYHKVGINEYIIRERLNEQEGMIRVIHVVGGGIRSLMGANKDFNFAPHNHRQNVTLYGLVGCVHNVTLTYDNRVSGHGARRHVFESELVDGRMGTHPLDCGDLDISQITPITDKGVFMESQEIHTVIAEPDSAFLVVEGELATVKYPRHVNYCYSAVAGFKLETTPDLYLPLDDRYLRNVEMRFSQAIENIIM